MVFQGSNKYKDTCRGAPGSRTWPTLISQSENRLEALRCFFLFLSSNHDCDHNECIMKHCGYKLDSDERAPQLSLSFFTLRKSLDTNGSQRLFNKGVLSRRLSRAQARPSKHRLKNNIRTLSQPTYQHSLGIMPLDDAVTSQNTIFQPGYNFSLIGLLGLLVPRARLEKKVIRNMAKKVTWGQGGRHTNMLVADEMFA